MSDIEDTMSCDEYAKHGFHSYRQCCDILEGSCPPKKTCQTLEYTHFIPSSNCSPEGWRWTHDSCWIDSVLYALFAPNKLSIDFSNMLDTIKSIIVNIRLNKNKIPIIKF